MVQALLIAKFGPATSYLLLNNSLGSFVNGSKWLKTDHSRPGGVPRSIKIKKGELMLPVALAFEMMPRVEAINSFESIATKEAP